MGEDNAQIQLMVSVGERLESLAHECFEPPFAVVAWSGGADSTALLLTYLELLRQLYGQLPEPLIAVHVDHGLRPDSGRDAIFCERMAARLDDVHLVRLAIPPGKLRKLSGSMEQNARIARYQLLGQAARARGCKFVLTGHHADDNLETLLLALIRGSGLTGLAGIRPGIALSNLSRRPDDSQVRVLRPMLDVSRNDIKNALEAREVEYLQDPTNQSLEFRRNVVRHRLVPMLKELADSDAPLLRTAAVLAEQRELLEEITAQHLSKVLRPLPHGYARGLCLSRHRLQRMPPGLRQHVLRLALQRSGNPLPPDRSATQRLVRSLSEDNSGTHTLEIRGARVDLLPDLLVLVGGDGPMYQEAPDLVEIMAPGRAQWGDYVVKAELLTLQVGTATQWVRYLKGSRNEADVELAATLNSPGPTHMRGRSYVEVFDADLVNLPMRVRPPKPGEVIRRFGGGRKPLAKIFIDKKVPRASRPFVPIVEDAAGSFLWAGSVVRGAAAPVTPETTRIIKVDLLY